MTIRQGRKWRRKFSLTTRRSPSTLEARAPHRPVQRYAQGVQPKDRPLPAVHDVDSYLDVRVRQSQVDGYYEPNARLLWQRLRVLKAAEVASALIAAGLAAVAAISLSVAAWAAVTDWFNRYLR